MTEESPNRALEEVAYCEALLAKGGLTVTTETLRDQQGLTMWTHYPEGEVFDPESGGQWFYHCHEDSSQKGEHGHFHCFVRPDGRDGPVHHLIAIGVDAHGRLVRLFTVNQWVVGDTWLAAEPTIALLERFNIEMPRPSYLVNRWLTAVVRANEMEIAGLIRERDAALAAYVPNDDMPVHEDRSLEVTSELKF
ncbi:hypothetical protein GCM10007989_36930 [Devosia pacifica]|uniref:DUF6969 domain-containing protein n=1 Tax=Devosia pacifica TaxID=1335967 RepID=A0A918SGA3_9HYPH|nr:hypothetical protein [Devosia pacifica]GHA37710.1 hypothetical protein GCM10007989_36930 [Devosia pacifica]